jgi:hypothetical protein
MTTSTCFEDKMEKIKEANTKMFGAKWQTDSRGVIFIYTPPKVGSTSLVSSLRLSVSHKFSIIHIHDEIMLNVFTGIKDVTINELIQYNAHIGKEVYVIDVYRTPIERKMSEYFEKLSPYHFNNSEENLNNYNVNRIIQRFNNLFPHLGKKDYFLEQYNIKLPDAFDFQKKYLYVFEKGVHYIKLRLSDSTSHWGKILTTLLDHVVVIVEDYETSNKKIGKLYESFKNAYKLPLQYYEEIKNDKFLHFYYDVQEQCAYLEKWERKLETRSQAQQPTFTPYTQEQYDFYINLCMENQYYNDFQTMQDHYMDDGCVCNICRYKRKILFEKIKRKIKINANDRVNHEPTKIVRINQMSKTSSQRTQNQSKQYQAQVQPQVQPQVQHSQSFTSSSHVYVQPHIQQIQYKPKSQMYSMQRRI